MNIWKAPGRLSLQLAAAVMGLGFRSFTSPATSEQSVGDATHEPDMIYTIINNRNEQLQQHLGFHRLFKHATECLVSWSYVKAMLCTFICNPAKSRNKIKRIAGCVLTEPGIQVSPLKFETRVLQNNPSKSQTPQSRKINVPCLVLLLLLHLKNTSVKQSLSVE